MKRATVDWTDLRARARADSQRALRLSSRFRPSPADPHLRSATLWCSSFALWCAAAKPRRVGASSRSWQESEQRQSDEDQAFRSGRSAPVFLTFSRLTQSSSPLRKSRSSPFRQLASRSLARPRRRVGSGSRTWEGGHPPAPPSRSQRSSGTWMNVWPAQCVDRLCRAWTGCVDRQSRCACFGCKRCLPPT